MRPVLVAVSGPPGSGKTTLARELGEKVGLPVIAKDDIKEMLLDTIGWSTTEWSKTLGSATWELLFLLIDRMLAGEASLIVESNFYPDVHAERLQVMQKRHTFELVEVNCRCDPEVLAHRYRTRERHPGHDPDGTVYFTPELGAELLVTHGPLGIGTLLQVDTNDPDKIDWDRIVSAVRRARGERDGSQDG